MSSTSPASTRQSSVPKAATALPAPRPYLLVRLDTTAEPLEPVELPPASSRPGAPVSYVGTRLPNVTFLGGAGGFIPGYLQIQGIAYFVFWG